MQTHCSIIWWQDWVNRYLCACAQSQSLVLHLLCYQLHLQWCEIRFNLPAEMLLGSKVYLFRISFPYKGETITVSSKILKWFVFSWTDGVFTVQGWELDPDEMEAYPSILSQEVFLSPHYLHKYLLLSVMWVQENPQLLETVSEAFIVGKP